MKSDVLNIDTKEEVKYISFPAFEETGLVRHGFSTKHGGVSQGCYTAMNLSFTRGDEPVRVEENFRRFSKTIGVTKDSLVLSDQIHDTVIRRVTAADRGKGITRANDIKGVDGLITNEEGVTLTTFYADCVPLFFLDPVNRAVGLSHAGWRGTVAGMAAKTVSAMKEAFGTDPSELLAGIGPSIGPCCYEVSRDVIMEFEKNTNHGIISKIARKVDGEHYMLDLWEANRLFLLDAGVSDTHITVTDLCTKCHSDDFFSHRIMGTARGSLAAMISLI